MKRLPFAAVLALALLAIDTVAQAQGNQPPPPAGAAARGGRGRGRGGPLVVPGRSVIATTYGIVASSQPLAAGAGVLVLQQGGNAIDAAIAANAAQGLMEPGANGLGGDLFAIIYIASENKLYGINASGWAATGLTPQLLASKGITDTMPQTGVYSVTVPGVVAGWDAMRARFGKLPFSTILAPAIHYADKGFPVTPTTAGWSAFTNNPNAQEVYTINGRAPRAGEVFKNPFLANSLRRIAVSGRDGFYKGVTAQAIVDVLKEKGGTMTLADLSEFQPEWVQPISTTYRGWTVYEMPPQTQGIAALEMLNMMETFPMAEWGFKTTKAMHVMIEAKKLAYADMVRYVGDPRYGKVPVAEMASKSLAAERAKLIDMNKANCSVPAMNLPGYTDNHGNDTIYLTAIDKDGNIVSLIQSNFAGFGSNIAPKQMGFMLQNRGALFSLRPNQVNTLAPRHRPLHTIIPAFMEKDSVHIGFGIMGGFNQAQAHAQFVSNVVDFGLNIQDALEAGRFTKGTFAGCDVDVESLIADSVRTALTAMGHAVTTVRPRSSTFGWGQAVMLNAFTGVHFGGSEPRHDGAAIPEAPPIFAPAGRAAGAGRGRQMR